MKMVVAGRPDYPFKGGETFIAPSDIDADGRDELIVGFSGDAMHELQLFDDLAADCAPMNASGGFVSSGDPEMPLFPSPSH